MKWLAALLTTIILIFLGWYFFAAERLMDQEITPPSPAIDPVLAAIDTLFAAGPPVSDRDGNNYATVWVGGQLWLAANLRVENCHATDGTEMRFADGGEKGPGVALCTDAPRYGYYAGDKSLGHGALYTHAAVRRCRLCPEGWRIASRADWEALFAFMGPESFRGKKLMKSYGSPFNVSLGGRVDDYGSVLGGLFEFWWTPDVVWPGTSRPRGWGPELISNGEVAIKIQDDRAANYVRCVRN